MTRILYVWQKDFPWDVRADKICRGLRDAGAHVTILARWAQGKPARELWNGISILRVGSGLPPALTQPLSYNPIWARAIRRAVSEIEPDLVMPREILLAEACASAARPGGVPVVMDMAEHYPAAMRAWKKYSRDPVSRLLVHRLRVPDIVERRAVPLCDGIVTVCDENSARLGRAYGYPLEKTAVVHNTPDLDSFASVTAGARTPPITFAHHGDMTPERGLERFLRGFAIVAPSYPDLRVVLAGGGESLEDVRGVARELGIERRVSLPGTYDHEELARLYDETDVGILPYRTDEFRSNTIPNKLFDYLACGKPVLVSNAEPLARIVRETGAGVVADCESARGVAAGIETLLASDLRTMSELGVQAARRKYNWKVDLENLLVFLGRFVTLPRPDGSAEGSEQRRSS